MINASVKLGCSDGLQEGLHWLPATGSRTHLRSGRRWLLSGPVRYCVFWDIAEGASLSLVRLLQDMICRVLWTHLRLGALVVGQQVDRLCRGVASVIVDLCGGGRVPAWVPEAPM